MKRNQMAAFAFAFALTGQALAVNGAQIYTPVVNNAGTLTLHSSSYEEASKLGIGLNYNLAVDPSETPTSNGSLKTYVHSVNLGIGSKLPFEFLHDRVHAFVDFSGHFLSPIDKTLESGLDAVDEKKFVIGNINLGAGFTIINNDEGGSATEEVEVDYNGKTALEIGFNARYLLDIAGQLEGDSAHFKLADAGSPTIVRDSADDSALYVLMPMRV